MSRGLIESTLNMKMDVYEAKTGTVLYLLDNKKYYCKSASDSTYYAYSFGEWNTNGDTIEINSFYQPFWLIRNLSRDIGNHLCRCE